MMISRLWASVDEAVKKPSTRSATSSCEVPRLDGGQGVDHVAVVDDRQEADPPAVLDRPQVPGLAGLGAGHPRGVEGPRVVPRDRRDLRIAWQVWSPEGR